MQKHEVWPGGFCSGDPVTYCDWKYGKPIDTRVSILPDHHRRETGKVPVQMKGKVTFVTPVLLKPRSGFNSIVFKSMCTGTLLFVSAVVLLVLFYVSLLFNNNTTDQGPALKLLIASVAISALVFFLKPISYVLTFSRMRKEIAEN